MRVVSKLNYEWEKAREGNAYLCCSGIGAPPSQTGPLIFPDKFLDVIVDTPAVMGSLVYSPGTQSILFPPPPPSGVDYSKSADVVVHEVTHAYIHRANRDFQEDFSHLSTRALREGVSDAMAGLFAVVADSWEDSWFGPGNPATGEPWVIGDSPAAPIPSGAIRDLTDPEIDFDDFEADVPDYHARGKAIGAFYYRLWTKHAVTDRRLFEFMLQVVDAIRDPDNDGYDLGDFFEALIDSVRPGESTLLDAINDVWNEMTPPPPTAGNPPPAPAFVAGAPYGCISGYSWYSVSWQPVGSATGYNVYASAGSFYEFLSGTPQTSIYIYTTLTIDVRVTASNIHGESSLSPDGFEATHSLCLS